MTYKIDDYGYLANPTEYQGSITRKGTSTSAEYFEHLVNRGFFKRVGLVQSNLRQAPNDCLVKKVSE